MKNKLFTFILSILMTLTPAIISAADILVKIDRNNIEQNESFTLQFQASETPDDDPDFSPLSDDFKILNQSTSSNISIINGNYTRSKIWKIRLLALKSGPLTIPSIHFGSDLSPEHKITISAIQSSSNKAGSPFSSELTISTDSSYPQAQIIITQRLLSSKNISQYDFSELKTNGVDVNIEPLGDKQYQTKRGDTSYLVIERSYAIYPQAVGSLTIEPSIASARISLNSRSAYDPFASNSKTIRRSSKMQRIAIKAIPQSYHYKHWMPASAVKLQEDFPENKNLYSGDPITRTLSLHVDGQSAAQLPAFTIPDIKYLKQYPDKANLNNQKNDLGINGTMQTKFALIPTQAGSYTLPAISIPWWNTTSHKLEIATLPSRTFIVSENPDNVSAPKTIINNENHAEDNANATVAPLVISPKTIDNTDNAYLWKALSASLFIAWMITLGFIWKNKKDNKENASIPKPIAIKSIYASLKKSCLKNDKDACKMALLEWALALPFKNNIHSLGELAEITNSELSAAISSLNNSLYSNDQTPWLAGNLFELCVAFEKSSFSNSTSKNKEQLESLY